MEKIRNDVKSIFWIFEYLIATFYITHILYENTKHFAMFLYNFLYLFMSKKNKLFKGDNDTNDTNDTGSSVVQITLFTGRIQHITEHIKMHKKDLNSKKSLLNLVGKRRKLLKYIKNHNIEIYRNIINKLEIRK